MKPFHRRLCLCLAAAALLLTVGCTTTRTEHGVQIQEKRGLNPLDYLPW